MKSSTKKTSPFFWLVARAAPIALSRGSVHCFPDGVRSRLLDHVVPVSDFCFGRNTGMSMDKVAVAGSTRAVPADVGLVREIL